MSTSQLSSLGPPRFYFVPAIGTEANILLGKKKRLVMIREKVGTDLRAFQRLPMVGTGGSQIRNPTAPPAGCQPLLVPFLSWQG